MRDRGYMSPEEFIGWYWVDPKTGEPVDWETEESVDWETEEPVDW